MELIETEAIVIGAGVVGVAIARELSKNNIETILIDKNNYIGEEVSARNSGVIHAGFYYPSKTLKAKFCNLGNKSIYNYCNDRSIYAKKTGKILVSSDKNSLSIFKNYKENAIKAGGQQLKLLSKSELTDLEPNVSCLYGLLSPETGVLDVHAYISSLENDFLKSGGVTSLNSELLSVSKNSNSFLSLLSNSDENFTIKSKIVIMATGLHSDNFFNKIPIDTKSLIKNINYSKGHYFKLSGKSPFNHLIYPLPTKFGLGIHAGFDIDGSIRFGPDTSRSSEISYKFDSGIKEKFVEAITEYWPGLNPEKLHEDYVGIRPKIQKNSESFADFSILSKEEHGLENFIFLQGIESPGLTCSLPIAKYVYNLVNN
tara:strand:+ start:63 stop:1175 length:1113 start_codon:yes stop_codon:yes gene_type:complete